MKNSKEGFEIVCAAIGNSSFVAVFLRKRVNELGKLLDTLAYLYGLHCALAIFGSYIVAPNMVYSLICHTAYDETSVILQDFDVHLKICLGTFEIDNAWIQAWLPISVDIDMHLTN